MDLKEIIASIPDFPKKGIMFRDITPVLANPEAMEEVIDKMADFAKEIKADVIVAPEARGFFFGAPLALKTGLPFYPVRKPGKLPREVISESYTLEYGTDELQIHADALQPGQRVLIVDDLLATGGTVQAIEKMVERSNAVNAGCAFVIELDDLKGKDLLGGVPTLSLVHYEGE